MRLVSRIYRVGVLMYGKRPSLSELIRWLKYS
jgi:ABC-2 type transport system permease protein